MKFPALRVPLAVVLVAVVGCKEQLGPPDRLPRPVSVIELRKFDPSTANHVAGSVASWKTEALGLEVSGRVEFVIEPEVDIEGRTFDTNNNTLSAGTPLARIDPTRYELQVNSVKAQITTAQRQKEALEIELAEVIPAQKRAAEAELVFQNAELERITPLVERSAITRAEYDRTLANRDAATAEVAQIAATASARGSEVASAEARILELEQLLAEAQRDLADCALVSSFPGQVAKVHVLPGAVVQRGQAVVTVQMMTPIKIEFEASADTTRRINYSDLIPIHVPRPDGSSAVMNGYLYMVDPVADPETRTFTVTLLSPNRRERPRVQRELAERNVATVDGLRKVVADLQGLEGELFADEDAIYEDDQGHFLWKLTGRSLNSTSTDSGPLIKVAKLRVRLGEQRVPLLGLWTLRELEQIEDPTFNVDTDVIARKILYREATEPWNGDTLMLNQERWLMRPGDLVRVDISGESVVPGFFVPMDAIVQDGGKHYVFLTQQGKAVRTEVQVSNGPDTLKRIAAPQLQEGVEVVASGTHYLVDGEPINVAARTEMAQ